MYWLRPVVNLFLIMLLLIPVVFGLLSILPIGAELGLADAVAAGTAEWWWLVVVWALLVAICVVVAQLVRRRWAPPPRQRQ